MRVYLKGSTSLVRGLTEKTPFIPLALATVLVLGVLLLTTFIDQLFLGSVLSATGRTAVLFVAALSGVALVVTLTKKDGLSKAKSSTSSSGVKFGYVLLFMAVNLVALGLSLWHGASAAAVHTSAANTSFISATFLGTIGGITTQPDAFLSGWITTVGMAGVVAILAYSLISQKTLPSRNFGVYSILVVTGVLAHLVFLI